VLINKWEITEGIRIKLFKKTYLAESLKGQMGI
jgi:hypothetical protein